MQGLAQNNINEIFNKLDINLKQTVLLIEATKEVQGNPNNTSIHIQPENCRYQSGIFSNIIETANNIETEQASKEANIWLPPDAEEEAANKRKSESFKAAILQTIEVKGNTNDVVSFCSAPIYAQDKIVLIVLQLDKKIYTSYYSLTNSNPGVFQNVVHNNNTSLLNSIIEEYLQKLYRDFNIFFICGNSYFFCDNEVEYLIRDAGKSLMSFPTLATNSLHKNTFTLFDTCNIISSMHYEGEESIGKLIVANKHNTNIEIILSLESPIKIDRFRAIRKLLEMCFDDICLVSDSMLVYGLGKILHTYRASDENLFLISFTKHYTWELLHDNNILMQAVYGYPQLQKTAVNRDKLSNMLSSSFSRITSEQIENLLGLVEEATKQKHGTMLVISNEAEKESERLKNQSTKIKPRKIDHSIIKITSSIDGAIMISPDSICYAIGVILDGIATNEGDSARGARYNSAIRYIESIQHECLAIVVSEDGSVDLIPE
ncbi:MAG: DNA integrity scanning protein DisA nucleotide-binding domain protein [Bacteroidota bacterium]